MTYPDTEPTNGIYELNMGFFWADHIDNTEPQYVTIDFKLTPEMENDYPGGEAEEKYGHIEAENQRENWLRSNIDILLDRGLVEKVFGHEKIDSVSALDSNLSDINFLNH